MDNLIVHDVAELNMALSSVFKWMQRLLRKNSYSAGSVAM